MNRYEVLEVGAADATGLGVVHGVVLPHSFDVVPELLRARVGDIVELDDSVFPFDPGTAGVAMPAPIIPPGLELVPPSSTAP